MADKPQKPEIDERWVKDWLGLGFTEIRSFLEKHAAFEEFYAAWEAEHGDQARTADD